MIDIMDREGSLPYLVKCLKEGVEPLVNPRTAVLVSRYLRGWEDLYLRRPPRLTLEGGMLLLNSWLEDVELPKEEGVKDESRNNKPNKAPK